MNRYKLSKAGVDVNQGLKRLNNDKEFYESLLQKFCEDTHYEDLKAALEQGDTDAAFRASHALKGAAGNLSFVRLYSLLAPMVEELRHHNLESAKNAFPEVTAAYESLMEVLKN